MSPHPPFVDAQSSYNQAVRHGPQNPNVPTTCPEDVDRGSIVDDTRQPLAVERVEMVAVLVELAQTCTFGLGARRVASVQRVNATREGFSLAPGDRRLVVLLASESRKQRRHLGIRGRSRWRFRGRSGDGEMLRCRWWRRVHTSRSRCCPRPGVFACCHCLRPRRVASCDSLRALATEAQSLQPPDKWSIVVRTCAVVDCVASTITSPPQTTCMMIASKYRRGR